MLGRASADFAVAVQQRAGYGARVLALLPGSSAHSTVGAYTGARCFASGKDFSSLLFARHRAGAERTGLILVAGDDVLLPFADESFDVVTSAWAMNFTQFDSVLCEIRRVLKPTGAWVIVDDYERSFFLRWQVKS